MVKNAIHNPDEPRHFMRIKRPEAHFSAYYKGLELANSTAVLKVMEVGKDLYPAVYYFPKADVDLTLLKEIDKSTHCPLKGDTIYYKLQTEELEEEDFAWNYAQAFERAEELKNHIAFDPGKVTILRQSEIDYVKAHICE